MNKLFKCLNQLINEWYNTQGIIKILITFTAIWIFFRQIKITILTFVTALSFNKRFAVAPTSNQSQCLIRERIAFGIVHRTGRITSTRFNA